MGGWCSRAAQGGSGANSGCPGTPPPQPPPSALRSRAPAHRTCSARPSAQPGRQSRQLTTDRLTRARLCSLAGYENVLGFPTASTPAQFTRAQSTCTVMLAPQFWAPLCLHCPELEQLRAVMHAEARHPRAPPPSRVMYAFPSPCSCVSFRLRVGAPKCGCFNPPCARATYARRASTLPRVACPCSCCCRHRLCRDASSTSSTSVGSW